MFSLLIKIIPLGFGAIVGCPMILALALLLLGSKNHAKIRTFAFFFGNLIVAVAVAILGFSLGHSVPESAKPTMISAIIDTILGLFFIIFGIKILFSKDHKVKEKEESGYKIVRWFLIGFLISVTNFDTVLLSLAAAKEIGESAVNEINKIILLIINILFFTAPIGLPLILYLIMPKLARPILEKINQVVFKYSRYILFIMFVGFGIYFCYKGFKFFI